jgi:choline dehydrogenase
MAAEMAESRPMRDKATFFWPPERVVKDRSKLGAFLGRICDSSYHPCGTVPMGPDNASDLEAATDGRGRIRGIEGLVVADASLMPTIPSAHTNLTTIMMGERFGAWLACGDW